MFPYSIRDNIGLVLTNSDKFTSNFKSESLQPGLRAAQHWLIQNPLALVKTYRTGQKAFSDEDLEQLKDQIEACYKGTVRTLNTWLTWLDERVVQPTFEIDQLYRMSTDIESQIEETFSTVTRLSEQRVRYTKIISDLQNANKAKIGLEALKIQIIEPVWDKDTTEKYNTICITAGCHSNCHSPCDLKFTEDYTSLGRWCSVFESMWPLPFWDGGMVHVQKIQEPDLEKLALRLSDATTEEQGLQKAKTAAEHKLIEIEENIVSAQDTIRILVDNYNKASLSRSSAGHIRSAIEMLKLRRRELETKANTDAELWIQTIRKEAGSFSGKWDSMDSYEERPV